MDTTCPDRRLDYIVEGIKIEGATVRYETVEGDDSGWILHVFEPNIPDTAMFTYPVSEADASNNDKRLRLRLGLDSHWRRCFMN